MFRLANSVVLSAAVAHATELSEGLETLSQVSSELFLSPTTSRVEKEMTTFSSTGNIDTNNLAPCSYATTSAYYNVIYAVDKDT